MSKKKVLIVEDDIIYSKYMSLGLEKRGFDIVVVRDGTEAFEEVAKTTFDLILLDIQLPKISGDLVLTKLRETYSPFELPIIMISAMDHTFDVVTYLKLGANDYIIKPTHIEVAIARINTQLDLVELNKRSLEKTELETLNSLIITYNHEINNPLTVAHGMINLAKSKKDLVYLDKVEEALERIAAIVKKISELQNSGEVSKVDYLSGQKMIKLK